MRYQPYSLGGLLAAGALLCGALPAQQGGSSGWAEAAPKLFEPVPPGQATHYYQDSAALRWQNVTVNWDLLTNDDAGQNRVETLTFNLFPDVELTGVLEHFEVAYGGGTVYSFRPDDGSYGHFYFSMVGSAATATFRYGDKLYTLRHAGDGVHTVIEVDESARNPCGLTDKEIVVSSAESAQQQGQQGGSRHHDHTVDVMVVYTDDARVANGGTAGVQSLINLAVFETNEGYANSDVQMRMNLVYCAEVAFNEDPTLTASTYLSQLRTNGDGIIDQVHTWRDDYGADAVGMITATLPGACGIAYLMTTLGAAFATSAFNVTADSCAVGNYSFGHEFGHNYGCHHDRANASAGVFSYSYGYRTSDNAHRTVMAYAPGTRILFWSNPSKLSPNGLPLGVAEGAVDEAENWKTLNNTATTVSAWRAYRDYGHRVMTTFASDNQFAGNMFDVEPHTDITPTAVGVNCNAVAGTLVTVDVYYRTGSYVGNEGSSAGWTLLDTGTASSAGLDLATYVPLSHCVTLEADQTYGFYVHLASYAAGTSALRYTNGGPEKYTNNFVTITTGVGKGTPAFTGSTFSFREWNGVLYYRGGDGQHSLTTLFAQNNGFAGNMFNVTPSKTVTINSFDVNIEAVGTVSTVDVWYKSGGYTGSESDPYDWTFLGTDMKAVAAGVNLPTRISVGDVTLTGGVTYGFYVNLNSYELSTQRLVYTNGSASYTDGLLTIDAGAGKSNAAFTGTTFNDRIWNGTINYSKSGVSVAVNNLVAGSTATVTVRGATPFGQVGLAYSTRGPGPRTVNDAVCGAVTVALTPPFTVVGMFNANDCGEVNINSAVVPGTTGLVIYVDVLDRGSCTMAGGIAVTTL